MQKWITKASIAQAAGVSPSAVSLVLNGRPHTLAPATAEKIRETAKRMGYWDAPNVSVKIVALIAQERQFFDSVADVFQRVARAATREFEEHDYHILTCFLAAANGGEPRLPRVLREGGVDGFLAVVPVPWGYGLLRDAVERLEMKAVTALRSHDETDLMGWVTTDERAAAAEAVERVVALGHTRVALTSALCSQSPVAAVRLAAYREALESHGIDVPEKWIADGDWMQEEGRRAVKELLSAGGGGGEPPTVIICANDWHALGAMEAARQKGMSVPGDLSVVGYDAVEFAMERAEPSLATVAQDFEGVGRASAQALMDWIEGRTDGAPTKLIPASFTDGDSLGPPRE